MLAAGFGSDDWPAQFEAITACKCFEEWGEEKSMLIASWHWFKGQGGDAIVIIETPVRVDARERVNRYVARLRAKRLLAVIEVQKQWAFTHETTLKIR